MIRGLLARAKNKIKEPILDFLLQALIKPTASPGQRAPFGWQELKLLRQALLSQNLCCIGGQMVPALERDFAEMHGVPYGVASTSGTAAIHVALGALDLNPGDEVITAPITDLGTVIPILYQTAIPVFADIDHTYNMDPVDVERKISPRTRAIIVVHLFGNPCDMDAMVEIAKRHKLPLIEDCSQAHLAQYKGKYVGTIGDIGCFSFQQSKHMTTGDGGMTITANKAYFDRMKLFADKGFARKGWGARAYAFHAPNYRMTELVGAVGLAQLKKLQGIIDKRRELGRYMSDLLAGIDGIEAAATTPGATHSFWLYPIRLKDIDGEAFAMEAKKEALNVVVGYTGKPIYLCSESLTAKKTYGTSQFPFSYRSDISYEYKEGLCPRAEKDLPQLITLPLDETWSRQQVEKAAGGISATIKRIKSQQSRAARPEERLPTTLVANHKTADSHEPKQDRKIAIGIIGCGQMGRWHFNAYKNNVMCKVTAVADSDFSRAQAFAAEVGARAYRSHSEVIANEPVDAVSVCTLPNTHRDIVIDALRAGIHVLCEKPLAISVDQAAEMLKAAQENKRLLLPAFKFRFYDEVLRAREMIESGGFGKILNFRLMFGGYIDMAGTWYVRKELSGGGVIMDNAPHAVDLIRFLLGEVRSVTAHAFQVQDIEVEDTAQLAVCLENGTVGTMDLSWSSSIPAMNYLELYGEDGTLLLDGQGIKYKFKTWREWKRISSEATGPVAFARQIDHFLESINGTMPTRVNENDGLMSQFFVDAAYESLKHRGKFPILDREQVFVANAA